MANFDYLAFKPEYKLFSAACIEAEKIYQTSPGLCAIGCRKALELGVKWVYYADNLSFPFQDNLQALIHNPDFYDALDRMTWEQLPYIIKLGNLAVHSEKTIDKGEALTSLHKLFSFIDWIDYTYGKDYPIPSRQFHEDQIPTAEIVVDSKKIKEQESLLAQNQEEIARLKKELENRSEELKQIRAQNQKKRPEYITDQELSEFATRKRYIDLDLKYVGWKFDGVQVKEEYPVDNMAGVPGESNGFVDYVLFGENGKPLALVEAKKTSVDPLNGKTQAQCYADSLEQKFSIRPMIFLSNGFSIWFWDEKTGPERRVGGFFSRNDLQRLMNRRDQKKDLERIEINRGITGRVYQMEAIRKVCEHVSQGFRKNLLAMATGTGKTRVSASVVDVFTRANQATNVLFLADRIALVSQARDAYKSYLPDMSLCNYLEEKDQAKNSRIIFSTYPTMLNAIDSEKLDNGMPLFTPAHFDLIIIDEAHRSIFKKYRAIFDYFDAILVGLTATPKDDVDKNTYDFFECRNHIPTAAYDYETATKIDKVLVPYHNIEVKTDFVFNGIHYDELSEEDQERYEADFTEDDGSMPEEIEAHHIDNDVFNEHTVDIMLQDLMTNGIKVAGGDKLAKTIIFAQNKTHASFIVERFNALYPQYGGRFCKRIVCGDSYAMKDIEDFKAPVPPIPWSEDLEKRPQIAVSVDMLDTGIDVPHIGNLVFFKRVFSKIKFWQMIGRGTRKCDEMECVDGTLGEYSKKRYFYIFDYCGNFEFFRENPNGIKGQDSVSLHQAIFTKRIQIAEKLQDPAFSADDFLEFRTSLIKACHDEIMDLNAELGSVRIYRETIEQFRDIRAFDQLDTAKVNALTKNIAPLVYNMDTDEYAKRYDNNIYTLMLDALGGGKDLRKASGKLVKISQMLKSKGTINAVNDQMPLIYATSSPDYWVNANLVDYEEVRQKLRGLLKYLSDISDHRDVFTNLTDTVLQRTEGKPVLMEDEYKDYKAEVNEYIITHKNDTVIYKLTHNIPLTEDEFAELEKILTKVLGTSEDYEKHFHDTPFGILVRRIAGMDHDAVQDVFADFINSQGLNTQQINFVKRIIAYIETNGYIREVDDLIKPPFDSPANLFQLFSGARLTELLKLINGVKENAERHMA